MVDIVDPATRSRMMAGIGGRNTKPEVLVRKHLHSKGLRYVLGGAKLPGRPDLVLPKWKVAVFVHGCFWHWHGCSLSKIPNSNRKFWKSKLSANRERDAIVELALISAGWRIAVIWECATRGVAATVKLEEQMEALSHWIRVETASPFIELTFPNNTPHVL